MMRQTLLRRAAFMGAAVALPLSGGCKTFECSSVKHGLAICPASLTATVARMADTMHIAFTDWSRRKISFVFGGDVVHE